MMLINRNLNKGFYIIFHLDSHGDKICKMKIWYNSCVNICHGLAFNSTYKRGSPTKNEYTKSSRIFTDKLESLKKSFKEKVDWCIGCTKINFTVYSKGCQNVSMSDNNKKSL